MLAMARPLAVIVAGLGEEGKLRAVDLVYTVRQAVIAYAQRLAEGESPPAEFELAATLIGSGGTGISAGSSAQMVAQGALGGEPEAARQRLAAGRPPDPGRALSRPRQRRLARAAGAGDGDAEPAQGRRLRQVGRGRAAPLARLELSRRRLRLHQRVDRRAASTARRRSPTRSTPSARAPRCARSRRRRRCVSELVAKASNDANRDAQIGRTLFDLLVPVEMEPFLGGTTEMVIELDSGTAGAPVGVLDTVVGRARGQRPAAVGDPQQAAAQAAHERLPRPAVATPTPTAASSSSASRCSTSRCTRRCRARAPRRSRSRRA